MFPAITITKASSWQFETYGSAGLGLGFLAGTGGHVILKDTSGTPNSFWYGGLGAGLSAGLKLPKIGKFSIKTTRGPLTGSLGPGSFPSAGKLYMTDQFKGAEFKKSDIQGICAFVEIGGGIIAGSSGMAMLINLNPAFLVASLVSPLGGAYLLLTSAKGILLMAGVNAGLQAQIGITGSLGYLH